ncbi:hypothetical protein ACK1LH_20655 [Metabacillus indicus]|uniref:hypothetical protein n=1 Tax=Metabacillus indicus TaxID=246786 RepID=UPI0039842DD4
MRQKTSFNTIACRRAARMNANCTKRNFRNGSAALRKLNEKLAASIDFDSITSKQEPLMIGEGGIVENFNPQNPSHKKWMDD